MSWPLVSFIDVCNIQGGTQPPKSTFIEEERSGYVRLLQIQDFKRSDKAVFVRDNKNLKKCSSDDVLIGRYGASVGKILTGLAGAYNVALVKTVPDRMRLDKNYLYHFLCSPNFQTYILNVGSRAAQAGFNKDDLAGLEIPLPPLEEQKRIAAILDKADAIRRKRQQAIKLADDFLRSVFLEMFGDPVTNPKGWEVRPLIELIDKARPITYGILKPGEDIHDGVPYIRVIDMRRGVVLTEQLRRTTYEIAKQYKRSSLKAGDILLSIRGHVGRLAIVPDELQGANITQDTARLATNENCNSLYLLACLETKQMQLEMQKYVKGAAVKGINLADVKELKIPIPPMSSQKKLASKIELATSIIRKGEIANFELENIFKSLSQKAFSGKI